jgi:hypothetical protein
MLTAATLSLGHRSHVMSLTVSRPSDVRNGWKANGSVNESQMVRIDHRQGADLLRQKEGNEIARHR